MNRNSLVLLQCPLQGAEAHLLSGSQDGLVSILDLSLVGGAPLGLCHRCHVCMPVNLTV